MNAIKRTCLAVVRLFQKIGPLSGSIGKAIEQRQRQAVLDKNEAERLDRICNPSKYKYRGK